MKHAKKDNIKIMKYLIIIICCISIVLIFVITKIKEYEEHLENNDYNLLAEYIDDNYVLENEIKNNMEDTTNDKTEKSIKLEELYNKYKDVVAWIEIPDTNINYPVVQSKDNNYYLDHTYKKTFSSRGSIFLDKDVSFERPSDNFLIYGHRSKSGAMFEGLLQYEKQSFYQSHKTINFYTLEEEAEYEVLAVFRSKVYNKSDVGVFRYYFFINAESEADYNNFVLSAKSASIYETGVSASYGEQLLTLSTCAYHTKDGRFVVVAKKKT